MFNGKKILCVYNGKARNGIVENTIIRHGNETHLIVKLSEGYRTIVLEKAENVEFQDA
jgi:hypothetical protein